MPGFSQRSASRGRSMPRLPFYLKHEGKNYVAAFFSMLTVVTLCVTLAEPDWFSLHGGRCRARMGETGFLKTLGVNKFFYLGQFDKNIYTFGSGPNDKLYDCVTPKIVLVMRLIIAMTFFAIICSLFAFILDLVGAKNRLLKGIRQNGLWNILTVLICVTINGFCFWVSTLMEAEQKQERVSSTSKVVCHFDVSFYLVTAAGGLSVIATACNLLRRHPAHDNEEGDELLDDYDEQFVSEPIALDDAVAPPSPGAEHEEPPAYTP